MSHDWRNPDWFLLLCLVLMLAGMLSMLGLI